MPPLPRTNVGHPEGDSSGFDRLLGAAAGSLIAAVDRTDEVYWQLRHTHSNRERVHAERRSQYTVGGRDVLTRTKRLGIARQRVRLCSAQRIDWVRIYLRDGWVHAAEGRRVKRHPVPWTMTPGAYRAGNVHAVRTREGLDIPTHANYALDAIAHVGDTT